MLQKLINFFYDLHSRLLIWNIKRNFNIIKKRGKLINFYASDESRSVGSNEQTKEFIKFPCTACGKILESRHEVATHICDKMHKI